MAKVKVPKKIAGVKVPKKLRKQTKKAIALLESPAAVELALAGLALAGAAFAERVGEKAGRRRGAAGEEADEETEGRLEVGDMLRAVAREGSRRFLEGFEENYPAAAPLIASAKSARRRAPAKKRPAAGPAPEKSPTS